MANSSDTSWLIDPASTPLTDEKVFFLNEALRKAGAEYTDEGFTTFREWGLRATIKEEEDHYAMSVKPMTGRVNARWELQIDKTTGRVTETWSATLEPPPWDDVN